MVDNPRRLLRTASNFSNPGGGEMGIPSDFDTGTGTGSGWPALLVQSELSRWGGALMTKPQTLDKSLPRNEKPEAQIAALDTRNGRGGPLS